VFERFSDRARRVVVLAQEEARMLDHDYIGTEHLLLGLVHEGEGIGATTLEAMGVSLEAVRNQVEEIVGRGQVRPSGHIPFTARAKKVLELSLREAVALGHNYIGTEHILLGTIREGEGVAAQILRAMGVDLAAARTEVVRQLGERGVTGTAADERDEDPREPLEVDDDRHDDAPRCPSCRAWLEASGAVTTVSTQDQDRRPVRARVLYCRSCGTTIGTVA
jgi:ATP-dependent Clp protease ATP-binding subunit ClpA